MNYIQKIKDILSKKIEVEPDLLDLYSLLVCTTGKETTWKNVHDAWAIWKNKTNPDHRSLILFSELTPEVQALDEEYTEAIIDTAYEVTNI